MISSGNKGIRCATHTSTGVRPPWVTEQQTAPAKANLEYRARPLSFSGVWAAVFCTSPSNFVEPVDDGGGDAAIFEKRWRGE